MTQLRIVCTIAKISRILRLEKCVIPEIELIHVALKTALEFYYKKW